MYTSAALLDIQQRSHRSFEGMLRHCAELTEEELNREIEGFGVHTVRYQIHHTLGAQRYWISVLQGGIDVREDHDDFLRISDLEALRKHVLETTEQYLRNTSDEQLNTPATFMTWGDVERELVPANVVMRTVTHLFNHQGQILAMCRHLGKPAPRGLDYPLT